jgi:hypothetical protein
LKRNEKPGRPRLERRKKGVSDGEKAELAKNAKDGPEKKKSEKKSGEPVGRHDRRRKKQHVPRRKKRAKLKREPHAGATRDVQETLTTLLTRHIGTGTAPSDAGLMQRGRARNIIMTNLRCIVIVPSRQATKPGTSGVDNPQTSTRHLDISVHRVTMKILRTQPWSAAAKTKHHHGSTLK